MEIELNFKKEEIVKEINEAFRKTVIGEAFVNRVTNTVKWSIDDFDRNFKDAIKFMIQDMVKEVFTEEYKDGVKQDIRIALEEKLPGLITKYAEDFSIESSHRY